MIPIFVRTDVLNVVHQKEDNKKESQMISKSENRRRNIQEGRDMNAVSDEWLKEFVKDKRLKELATHNNKKRDMLVSVTEVKGMAQEILMLHKQEIDTNKLLCRQVGWIDKLKKQREALMADAKELLYWAEAHADSIGGAKYDLKKAIDNHKTLTREINNETT